jgi:citrate lyase subunit alpha/citrate CoA-transferase
MSEMNEDVKVQKTPFGRFPIKVEGIGEIKPFSYRELTLPVPGGAPQNFPFIPLHIYNEEELFAEGLPAQNKLVNTLTEAVKHAIREKGLGAKDKKVITSQHNLRGGDLVGPMIWQAAQEAGLCDMVYAPSATLQAHKRVREIHGDDKVFTGAFVRRYVEQRVFTRLLGSMNNEIGALLVENYPQLRPGIFWSHGMRAVVTRDSIEAFKKWDIFKKGRLEPNLVVVIASATDKYGNCTGLDGRNAFGGMGFAWNDLENLDKENTYVVVVSDTIMEKTPPHTQVPHWLVDAVVPVERIGYDEYIGGAGKLAVATGEHQKVAETVFQIIRSLGILEKKGGFSYQMGAGKIPLDVIRQITELMEQDKNVRARFSMGGATTYHLEQLKKGYLYELWDGQSFSIEAIASLGREEGNYKNHRSMSVRHSYDPFYDSIINHIDFGILGSLQFLYDSTGNIRAAGLNARIVGNKVYPYAGTGGSLDMATGIHQGEGIIICTTIAARPDKGIISIVNEDEFGAATIPGEYIDILATELGVVVNPLSQHYEQLIKTLSAVKGITLMDARELRREAERIVGSPALPKIRYNYNNLTLLVPDRRGEGFIGAAYTTI